MNIITLSAQINPDNTGSLTLILRHQAVSGLTPIFGKLARPAQAFMRG
jgi:hypothetical protein